MNQQTTYIGETEGQVLSKSCEYGGNLANTKIVLQGELIVIDILLEKDLFGLYTFGAGPCWILILVALLADEAVGKIAMVHIDGATTERDLYKLMYQLKDRGVVAIDGYLFSGRGSEKILSQVSAVLQQVGVKLVGTFCNSPAFSAAIVNRNGQIYFGNVVEFNAGVNLAQIENMAISRELRFYSNLHQRNDYYFELSEAMSEDKVRDYFHKNNTKSPCLREQKSD